MKILLTAGPTREPIDEVRFLSNRSSGKVGLSLARAAHDAGHRVTLLLGPVCAGDDLPEEIELVRFGATADLQRELDQRFDDCDALIMAAAVADYRPAEVIRGKTPRAHDPEAAMTIRLEPTPDLVAGLASRKREDQLVIAFALEEDAQLERRATEKMRRKRVDAILGNPLSSMEGEHIEPTLFHQNGEADRPGRMTKRDFAPWLIARIEALQRASV